jgi:threonylcarbamoyladenosine tRNA methylthiotransferase MtaB
LEEAQRLIDRGYREIVLTGIHLGHYGIEWSRGRKKDEWLRLAQLVERVANLDGDFRIRLSSIEATEVTRELINVMARRPDRVCPHLHVSMQSGSDAVLRRMRRRWGSQRFIDRCRLAQRALDRPAITTDIIVGFPGETEEDFQATCDVATEVGFSKIHIFPFSARRGTPAAEMPGQTPPEVKAERVKRLALLERELRARYYERLVSSELEALVVGSTAAGRMAGITCRFAHVEFKGGPELEGQLVPVLVTAAGDERLSGKFIDQQKMPLHLKPELAPTA